MFEPDVADKLAARASSKNVSETDKQKIENDLEAINSALKGIASMQGESRINTQKAANSDDNTGTNTATATGTKKTATSQRATSTNSYQNRRNEAAIAALKAMSETFGNDKLKIIA